MSATWGSVGFGKDGVILSQLLHLRNRHGFEPSTNVNAIYKNLIRFSPGNILFYESK